MKMILSVLLLSILSSSIAIICNFTYDENLPNYPENLINTIVSEKNISKIPNKKQKPESFTCDDEEYDGYSRFDTLQNNVKVSSRFGSTAKEAHPSDDSDEFESEPLCDSTKSTIRPRTLPNILNQMVIVLNNGNIIQEVTMEKCGCEKQPCKFATNFPLNVVTKCKQKYQKQTVKVLNEHDKAIIDESVYIPSGCECHFKYKSN